MYGKGKKNSVKQFFLERNIHHASAEYSEQGLSPSGIQNHEPDCVYRIVMPRSSNHYSVHSTELLNHVGNLLGFKLSPRSSMLHPPVSDTLTAEGRLLLWAQKAFLFKKASLIASNKINKQKSHNPIHPVPCIQHSQKLWIKQAHHYLLHRITKPAPTDATILTPHSNPTVTSPLTLAYRSTWRKIHKKSQPPSPYPPCFWGVGKGVGSFSH